MAAAVLAALFLARICGNGVEPVESKELPSPVPAEKTTIAPGPRSFFEISECSVKEAADSQPFNYSEKVHEAMEELKNDHKLNSEVDVSGESPDKTKSMYQHPTHDHYDVVEIQERQQGQNIVVVELDISSYWTDDAPENRPHKPFTSMTFEPCNVVNKGWVNCRTSRIRLIRDFLVGLDQTHK
jgi:hypothetical protein